MRDDIRDDILRRLDGAYRFKQVGDWLRQGTCPQCGKKELYANANAPWVVQCGRANNCGWSAHVKDLYPDAFEKFNERYPATTKDPNATADAYLSFVRGFDITKIRGWYRQGHFKHFRGDRQTATVVFDIDRAAGILMERFVETVRVTDDDGDSEERKANFEGRHKGLWWAPPGMTVEDGDEIWLVEGCLDAIALHLHGIKAAATLSCGNYPDKALEAHKGKDITLVWALDADPAGLHSMRKHVKTARVAGFECKAAIIPQKGRAKTDWNDLHLAGRLEETDVEEYRYQGDLLLAESAKAKGILIWQHTKSTAFAVEFMSRTYWFSIPPAAFSQILEAVKEAGDYDPETGPEYATAVKVADVHQIAACVVKFLYFQKNKQTDESWYYTRVDYANGGKTEKGTFTGAQVACASEFKKRLLSIAPGALYSGNSGQLNWLVGHHLDDIKTVDTVDFIGYSKDHKAYVFNIVAVAGCKVYPINDEDFFEIGKTSVKSLNSSLSLTIGDRSRYQAEWINDVHAAFGAKGLIAVAFFFGSLFAEQIRGLDKSFPFLEIVGEAGSGKSTLIEFLWKLVGRADYEGFDPNKSTLAARARIFSQVANLPICMIESDREDTAKARQFDWDELKTAYNGRASRARGVKNGGNETNEPPFRGSVLISQNAAVNASEAIMQRLIHLNFDTSGHTPQSKIAADRLAAMPVETVSHFLIKATTAEKAALETYRGKAAKYEKALIDLPEIKTIRIAKNHGQLMALVDALADIVSMPSAWRKEAMLALRDAAIERQHAIGADHQIVEEFWEMYDYLGSDTLNHSKNGDLIAINLNHFNKVAIANNQSPPTLTDLKKHLKSCRSHRFIEIKAVNSAIEMRNYESRTVMCWVFDKRGAA